jgi:hypothetical protein
MAAVRLAAAASRDAVAAARAAMAPARLAEGPAGMAAAAAWLAASPERLMAAAARVGAAAARAAPAPAGDAPAPAGDAAAPAGGAAAAAGKAASRTRYVTAPEIDAPAPPSEAALAQAELLYRWFSRYGRERFLIENTQCGDLEAFLPLMPEDVPLCMDTGHLLLEKKSVLHYYKTHRRRIKEIHLHRVDGERAKADNRLADHRALDAKDAWFAEFLPELKRYEGLIDMEVFSWEEAQTSLEVLQRCGIGKLK